MQALGSSNQPRLVCLDWDSSFFGFRVARLEDRMLTPELAVVVDSWCKSNSIDCLYFLADSADRCTTVAAEDTGYRLMGIRLTLDRRLDGPDQVLAPTPVVPIRRAKQEDIPRLREIARVSHRDSRFYRDPNISMSLCDQLYETWIEKSVRGYAEEVLVATKDEQAVGYLSCHLRGKRGEIGLFSVASDARGAGLGLDLIVHSFRWFADQAVQQVSVVTQGSNISAIRTYEKAGFRSHAVEFWYHKWFGVHRARGVA